MGLHRAPAHSLCLPEFGTDLLKGGNFVFDADISQRETEFLSPADELQIVDFRLREDTISRSCACRSPEQSDALVEADRIDGETCRFSRFSNLQIVMHLFDRFSLNPGLHSRVKVTSAVRSCMQEASCRVAKIYLRRLDV